MDVVAQLLTVVLYLLIAAIVLRSILSFWPQGQGNEFARFLVRFTEPLLAPPRRYLPRTGMIDFSGLVVIVLLYLMVAAVERAAKS